MSKIVSSILVLILLICVFFGSQAYFTAEYEEDLLIEIDSQLLSTQNAVREAIDEKYYEAYVRDFGIALGALTDVRISYKGEVDIGGLPEEVYLCDTVCQTYSLPNPEFEVMAEDIYGILVFGDVAVIAVSQELFSNSVLENEKVILSKMYLYNYTTVTQDSMYKELEKMYVFYLTQLASLRAVIPTDAKSMYPVDPEQLGNYRDQTAIMALRDIKRTRDEFDFEAVDSSMFGRSNEPYQRFVKSLRNQIEKKLQVEHTKHVHSLLRINDAALARRAAAIATENALAHCTNQNCVFEIMGCGAVDCVVEKFLYIDAPQLCSRLGAESGLCEDGFVDFYSPYCREFESC